MKLQPLPHQRIHYTHIVLAVLLAIFVSIVPTGSHACDCENLRQLGFPENIESVPADFAGLYWDGDLYHPDNDLSELFIIEEITNATAIRHRAVVTNLYDGRGRHGPHRVAPENGFTVGSTYAMRADADNYPFLRYDVSTTNVQVNYVASFFVETATFATTPMPAMTLRVAEQQQEQLLSTMSLDQQCASHFIGTRRDLHVDVPPSYRPWLPLMQFTVTFAQRPWIFSPSNCEPPIGRVTTTGFATYLFTLCKTQPHQITVEENQDDVLVTSPRMRDLYPVYHQQEPVEITVGLIGHEPLLTLTEEITLTCA